MPTNPRPINRASAFMALALANEPCSERMARQPDRSQTMVVNHGNTHRPEHRKPGSICGWRNGQGLFVGRGGDIVPQPPARHNPQSTPMEEVVSHLRTCPRDRI